MLHRRNMLKFMGAAFAATVLQGFARMKAALANSPITKLMKNDDEWQKILTPAQFDILRREGTERPFTSPLLNEHGVGEFQCVACDLPLFKSDTKFDSGTGWPSFFDSIDGSVETKTDNKLFMTRIEYHCARCGGHHGHVFDDGPAPTHKRYCNNGVALKFVPKKA